MGEVLVAVQIKYIFTALIFIDVIMGWGWWVLSPPPLFMADRHRHIRHGADNIFVDLIINVF